MNYDRIILELLDRVVTLEQDVKMLKEQSLPTFDDNSEEKAGTPHVASSNTRDTTKYQFDGHIYGKGRLVLAVVQKYVAQNPVLSKERLLEAFDKRLQGSLGVVRELSDAKQSYVDWERRFFTRPSEIIKTADGSFVVCTQWGTQINNFINRAKQLGLDIKPIT